MANEITIVLWEGTEVQDNRIYTIERQLKFMAIVIKTYMRFAYLTWKTRNIDEMQYLKYDIFHLDRACIKCILHDGGYSRVIMTRF